MIDFQFIETEITLQKNTKKWVEKVINCEKKQLGEIMFVFCTDSYLLEKNKQFLKKNTLTDVIAFDYCQQDVISGDILISVERVKENAKIFNVNFIAELNRVIVHGLLHLLGYKDKTNKESEIMRSKENYYISIK